MDNSVIETPKVEDDEETVKQDNDTETETESVAGSTSIETVPIIDDETKKLARDAKAKRKDEKTVQQVLKSLDSLKTPREKLSAMCKKYSELLHENRQLQAVVKQSEKNINMIHREKEQFRHERSKAVLAKMRMEQLCRELQKLNKAQQEETALKLRVEEEKRKEICFTFQSAFAEMNTLTHQNNEKSAKMREENLEMREQIKFVRQGLALAETQLDNVRQHSKLELELAEKKCLKATLELTAEKEALMKDKKQLLMKLAQYHVRIKEHEGTEQCLKKQIKIYEEKFEELKQDSKRTTELLKTFRPESREIKKKMLKLEKETALWKQRWEKTNGAVLQMTEIKEKRDAEMLTLTNKLSTLQELCKAFQRERASLIAQLRDKSDGAQIDRKAKADENRKSMKQVESIAKDCEKLKENLSKLEGSFSEVVREAFRASVYDEESNEPIKENKKINKKMKNGARRKYQKRQDDSVAFPDEENDDEASNDDKVEESKEDPEENDNETSDVNAIEASVGKVLAEQALLETKIDCLMEIGQSIKDSADLKYDKVDDEIAELTGIPAEEDPGSSMILLDNAQPEVAPPEVNARTLVEKSSGEAERLDDPAEVSQCLQIIESELATIGNVENLEDVASSNVDSQSVAAESANIEPPIVRALPVDEQRSTDEPEVSVTNNSTSLDTENVARVRDIACTPGEAKAEAESSSDPVPEIKDNPIEA